MTRDTEDTIRKNIEDKVNKMTFDFIVAVALHDQEKREAISKITTVEAKENQSTCIICLVNKADYMLLPYAHANYCGKCSQNIDTCSICRSPIDEIIKFYLD